MHRRRLTTLSVSVCLVAVIAACSDGGSTSSSTTVGAGLLTTPSFDFGPTTTFMPDCVPMPRAADIAAIVGVPLQEGTVVATGTCEFRGFNDQTRVITLALLSDPADIASFNDLVSSVGTTTPMNDALLPTAMIGPDHRIFAVTPEGIYSVVSALNDAPPEQQYVLSLAVLTAWLNGA